MWTSPQRMLMEMDGRVRDLQRRAYDDMDARKEYYANVARSGDAEAIRNLAMLGDKEAQAVFEPTTRPDVWSLQTRLEMDVGNAESRSLAILIADEIVDAYEGKLDELIMDSSGHEGGQWNQAGFSETLGVIKTYYDRYRHIQQNDGTHNNFSNLEYELGGERNSGGRLYGANTFTDINSIIGALGLACLIRTSDFEEGSNEVTGRYNPGAAAYLGNVLSRAQSQGIHTSEIMSRIRDRLQSQIL